MNLVRKMSMLPALCVACSMSSCYNRQFQRHIPVSAPIRDSHGATGYAPIGVIEFDDMGELWDRCDVSTSDTQCQLNATVHWIQSERNQALQNGESSVVIAFIHGWNNNAGTENQNLTAFQQTISTLQDQNQKLVSNYSHCQSDPALNCPSSSKPTPVRYLGVYLGWRGRTLPGFLNYLTFFGREAGAKRVASVSSTEVIFRLSEAAMTPVSLGAQRGKFILAGHSFGGLVVERALAQALTAQVVLNKNERTPQGCSESSPGYETFADLIVLINPAIEAVETQQLIDMMKRSEFHTCSIRDPSGTGISFEPPLLISIKARNDIPTGPIFHLAHELEELNKSFHPYSNTPSETASVDKTPSQRAVFANTVGYLSYFHNYCYVDDRGSHDSRDALCNKIIDEVWRDQHSVGKFKPAELSKANPQIQFSKTLPKVSSSGRYHQGFAWTPPMLSNSYQLSRLYTRFDPTNCTISACDIWNNTPYWIFTVPPSVIDGHNGFWTEAFRDLLTDIIQVTAQKQPKRVSFK